MGLIKIPRRKIYLAILLSLLFFGLADDRYRGWWDTHQFLVEARAWYRHTPPPVPQIAEWAEYSYGPDYTYPLTSYSWSFLYSDDDRSSMLRVRLLNALMISITFFTFFVASGGSLILPILLFLNSFTRKLIVAPISEPSSFVLLICSFLFPRGCGVWAVLQAVTRPAVALLHIPSLWKNRCRWTTYVGAVTACLVVLFKFRKMALPPKVPGIGFSFHKLGLLFNGFGHDLNHQLFFRAGENLLFFKVFSFSLILALGLYSLFRLRKDFIALFAIGFYLFAIATPPPFTLSVRYFYPLILFLILEILARKRTGSAHEASATSGVALNSRFPQETRNSKFTKLTTVGLLLAALLCIHLTVQAIQSVVDIHKDQTPDSDSQGFNEAKTWISFREPNAKLMMHYMRFCLNFFDKDCEGFPKPVSREALTRLGAEKRLIVFTGKTWITEDQDFEKDLRRVLELTDQRLENATTHFHEVRVVDLQKLLQ